MIKVRKAGIKDAVLISGLGAKTFFEAFGEFFKKENIESYIAEKFSAEHIKEEISDPQASFFLAYYDNMPAGYAKLINSSMPEQIKELKAIEMQRIYVLRQYYDMKIGKELMLYSLDYAFRKGFNSMWLGVWQQNERAVEFYRKWGFEHFGTRNFKVGNEINEDFIMLKKI